MNKLKIILLVFLCSSCSTAIRPKLEQLPVESSRLSNSFSHDSFDKVLSENVSKGKVNYKVIKDSEDFKNYYSLISTYSPDNNPELFPTKEDKLTYWINAYNAAAIRTVLEYYPITSVMDVSPPSLFFYLPEVSGFFVFQKPIFGGDKISLYSLENKIIRERFNEPRIHFALNCASISCPQLPSKAFRATSLESDLENEAKKFFAEKRNLEINHETKTIKLSSILKWYEKDFVDIRIYVSNYVDENLKEHILNPEYQLEFIDYNWGLNEAN